MPSLPFRATGPVRWGRVARLLALLPGALLAAGGDEIIELEPYEAKAGVFEYAAPEALAAPISTLTAEDLDIAGAVTLTDALESRAGVHVRSWTGNPAQAEVSLRGFGENSGLRVLVLVDGQRLNRPDLRGVNWLQVPLSAIERVEVIRGATTTLYGNHAVGGVINIITKQGSQGRGGEASLTHGSYGMWDAGLSVSGGYRSVWGFGAGHHQESAGWRGNSAYAVSTAYASGAWQVTGRWRSRLVVIAQENTTEFPGALSYPQYRRDPTYSTAAETIRTFPGSPSSYSFSEATIGDLLSQNRLSGVLGGEVVLDAGLRTRFTDSRLSGSAVDDEAVSLLGRMHWKRQFEETTVTTGLEWTRDDLDLSRLNLATDEQIARASLAREIAGAFVFASHEAGETVTLSAGARFERTTLDYDQLVYSNPFLPREDDPFNIEEAAARTRDGWSAELGVLWEVTPEVEVHARVDRFYRYPVTDEIAAYQGFNLDLGFNSGLEPEEGYAAEIGFLWQRKGAAFGVTAFAHWMENEIVYDERERLNVNMPETTRWGVEVQGRLERGVWATGFFLTVQRARITSSQPFLVSTDEINADPANPGEFYKQRRELVTADGNDVPLVPQVKLAAYAELRWPENLTTRLGLTHTGEQFAGNDWFNEVPIPTYTLVSLSTRLQLGEHWEAFAAIDNLTDERYASLYYATGDLRAPALSVYPSPPRTVRGGLRLTF